jgi:DoxX-like family
VPDLKLIRLSVAMVWFYQGLWCKVLGGVPRQEAVISTVPFMGAAEVRMALMVLGLVECGLAVWVLSGQRMRQAATVQTALLAAMNSGGLIWAWHLIPDPVGMIVQNIAFLVLVWIASEDRPNAAHS